MYNRNEEKSCVIFTMRNIYFSEKYIYVWNRKNYLLCS